jgi:hypothetical protein
MCLPATDPIGRCALNHVVLQRNSNACKDERRETLAAAMIVDKFAACTVAAVVPLSHVDTGILLSGQIARGLRLGRTLPGLASIISGEYCRRQSASPHVVRAA